MRKLPNRSGRFKNFNREEVLNMAWFNYTPTQPNGPLNPDNYTLAGSTPTCTNGPDLCAIQADNDGSDRPEFTEALKDDMILALVAHQQNSNVKLKS